MQGNRCPVRGQQVGDGRCPTRQERDREEESAHYIDGKFHCILPGSDSRVHDKDRRDDEAKADERDHRKYNGSNKQQRLLNI
jgi:hypothetical protein